MEKIATYRDSDRGFTLFELLLVLAISSLVLTAIVGLVSAPRAAVELRAAQSTLLAGLRDARAQAIRDGKRVAVTIDVNARQFSVGNAAPESLGSEALAIEFTTARSLTVGAAEGMLLFLPDGSSSGGRIILNRDATRAVIDIDWLTGRIEQVDVETPNGTR